MVLTDRFDSFFAARPRLFAGIVWAMAFLVLFGMLTGLIATVYWFAAGAVQWRYLFIPDPRPT